MRRFATWLLAVLFCAPVFAQKVSTQVSTHLGPEIKEGRRDIPILAGIDESNCYVVHLKRKSMKADRLFKQDMTTSASARVKKENYKRRRVSFYGSYFFSGKLYLFYTLVNRYENTISLLARELDGNSLVGGDTYTELATLSYMNLRDISWSSLFDVRISPNGKRMLIVSQLVVNDVKRLIKHDPGKPQFHMTVLDDNFETLWDDDTKLPFKKNKFVIDGFRVENDGGVLAVALETSNKAAFALNRRDSKPDYQYHVLYYNTGGKLKLNVPLALDSGFITEMQAAIDLKGRLVASGFYAKQKSYTMQGVFYMAFDTVDGLEITQRTHRLNAWFVDDQKKEAKKAAKSQPAAAKKKKKKGDDDDGGDTDPAIYNLHLDNLMLGEDDHIVLVAEQYYVIVVATTTRSANGSTTTHYDYYYYNDDILAVNFDDNGEIAWKDRITKRQRSVNDGGRFLSYLSCYADKRLSIFYNETIGKAKKSGKEDVPFFYPGKDTRIMDVNIDPDGNVNREIVPELTNTRYMLEPSSSKVFNGREVFLYLRKGSYFQMANVVLHR